MDKMFKQVLKRNDELQRQIYVILRQDLIDMRERKREKKINIDTLVFFEKENEPIEDNVLKRWDKTVKLIFDLTVEAILLGKKIDKLKEKNSVG